MGQLTTMFYAGILTPTLCTVLVFIIFMVCWFKCNLRERINELLDGRKTSRKQANVAMVMTNSHLQKYNKPRRDTVSLEGSECDSAFDSLHEVSTEEFPGSRLGSRGSRTSTAPTQCQAQVGPVVDLLWEVSETGGYAMTYSEYARAKTVRTISSDTISNNLDQKRMSKVPSKDLVSSLASGACQPGSGAHLLPSPTDNTMVGISLVDNGQTPASVEMDSQIYDSNRRSVGDYHRDFHAYHTGPSEYLAAINMDCTDI